MVPPKGCDGDLTLVTKDARTESIFFILCCIHLYILYVQKEQHKLGSVHPYFVHQIKDNK